MNTPTITVELPPVALGDYLDEQAHSDLPAITVVKRTAKKVTVELDRSAYDALAAFSDRFSGPAYRGMKRALLAVKRPAAPKAPKPAPAASTAILDPSTIAAMPKPERMALAKAEAAASKARKDGGKVGEPPARPILDWMESPFKTTPKVKGERRVQTTDEALREAIQAKLDAGMKGRDNISQALRSEGVPVGEARFRAVWRAMRAEAQATAAA